MIRATSITRTNGRGLGPGNRDFFGPCEMASSRQASAIWAQKRVLGVVGGGWGTPVLGWQGTIAYLT
jgi:hypothetical protein